MDGLGGVGEFWEVVRRGEIGEIGGRGEDLEGIAYCLYDRLWNHNAGVYKW